MKDIDKDISLTKTSLFFSLKDKLKNKTTKPLGMVLLVLALFVSVQQSFAQCGPFQVYESFGTGALPTQGGTWVNTSVNYNSTTANIRTGGFCLSFNAVNDAIRTPLIANPGVFSFWYKRSGTTTGTPNFTVETSPDNATWTGRGSATVFTGTYQQFSVDLGALGLTNIYVRVRDARGSLTAERYIDDLSWTSTVAANNTVLIQGASCSPTIVCGTTYSLYDRGGVNDQYSINFASAPMTILPGTAGGKVTVNITSLTTESATDYLRLYNGNTIASPAFAGSPYSGSTAPGSFTSTDATGAITVDFTSDFSLNYAGFVGTVTCTVPCTPPTTQANTVTATPVGSTTATINWARGNGNNVIVVAYPGAVAGTVPASGTAYTGNAAYGSGTALGTGFVVYNGTGTTENITNLAAGTQYTFVAYEFNTTGTCYNTATTGKVTFTTVCSPPTVQATINAYTNNTTGTTLTANWTRGNGANVLVVARLTATTAVDPVIGTVYTANTAFGSGTGSQITGAGNFVVYSGTGTTVNITALSPNTSYTFTVYEFNTGSCYLTPGSASAVTTPIPAYCTPTGNLDCTVNDFISNVTINTLNNTTTCGTGGYTVYPATGTQTTTLVQSTSYNFTLSTGAGTGTHGAGVWIDWNQNGVFTDAGEFFLVSNAIAASSTTTPISITVPGTASIGNTRMRVRYAYSTTVASTMSCTMGGTYGETEDYTVTIIAPCTSPTTQASTVTASPVGSTTATINWTRGNGTAGVIVVAYPGASAGTVPTSGTTYTANAAYGSGTAIGTGRVVYIGTGTTENITNLAAGTQYTFVAYEYNTTGTCYNTATTGNITFTTVCSPPTTQATIGAYTNNTTGTGLTINWTRGNGNSVIVVARLTATTAVDPTIGTTYAANTIFGSGATTGTGNFVVYSGSGTTVNVTGLTGLTGYTFTVYELNTAGTCYNTSGSSSAVTTVCTTPTTQATIGAYTNNTTGNSLTVNWTRGNGTAGVIVVGKLTATAAVDPISGTTYTANTAFGTGTGTEITGAGNFVVYVGTGTTVNITGLTAATNYTFTVYEYNTTNSCYKIAGSSSTVATPCIAPSTQASALTATSVTGTTATINWTSGNGTGGVIIVAYPGAAAGTVPVSGTLYTGNTAYGSGTALGTGRVIFNGVGNTVNVTNLTAGTQYTFVAYEFNSVGTCFNVATTGSVTFTTVCTPPTTQAISTAYTNNTTGTSLTVNWTRGNGTAGVIVVARLTSTAAVEPISGTNYTASTTFGSGTATGTGNFVVYKGTGTSVAVTGLTGLTNYTFTVYEYNTTSTCFLIPGAASAVTTVCTPPTTQAAITAYTNNTTTNSITANWTRGTGNSVIVVARLTATTLVNPSSGTTYTANTVFGTGTGSEITGAGNFVVYNGTGTTVNVTGLTSGANYTFTVYEYSTTGNCYKIAGSSSAVTIIMPPPANDLCSGAIDITCSSYTGDNTFALDETLPASTCGATGTTAITKGVWFSFTTPTTGSVTVSNCTGTTWDSYIRAYFGDCGTLSCVNNTSGIGYNDDGCSSQSTITFTATANTTYYILLTGYDVADFGAYTITATCPSPPPANDNCAGATAFPAVPTNGTCSTLSNQTTNYSTNSNVTPSGACTSNSGTPDDDVWFSFVATNTTTYFTATYVSGLTDVYWQVFSGACGSPMTSILCTDLNSGGTLTGLTIGNTYYIRMYSWASTGNTTQTICLTTPPPPPANDNCAGATAFPAVPTDGSCSTLSNQNTAAATNSNVTPTGTCTSNSGTPDDDVWFSFVATATTTIISATWVSGATDVYWQAFSSACGATMTSIFCSDNNSGGTLSGLTIGNTYYIRLYTWGSAVSTIQTICLSTPPPPPANDECGGATTLTPGAPGAACSPTAGNTTTGYTQSPVGCTSGYPDDDIWYQFTATSTSHIVTVDGAANFDAVVAVFTDCNATASPTGGDCFNGDDTYSDGIESLTLTGLTVGVTYYVHVYDWWDNSLGYNSGGNFTICVTTPGPPPNDNCAGALTVTPTAPGIPCTPTAGNSNGGTSSGIGCNTGNPDDDVWYRFTASATSHVVTVNGGTTFRPVVGVYTTCGATTTPAGGACFASAADGDAASLTLTSLNVGTTYYVKLYNYNTGAGNFTICVTTPDNICPGGAPLNDQPCNAVDITLGTIASGNNACATTLNEPAATPTCWSTGIRHTVWYSFLAPASGNVKIRTAPGTLVNTQIAVYTGTCGSGLTTVASGCNNDAPSCGGTSLFISEVSLTGLVNNQRYYVSVDGRLDSVGTFAITVIESSQPYPSSSGQECATPVTVCNTQISVGDPGYQGIGFTCDQTGTGNCTTGERGAAWYRINIDVNGTLLFDIVPNDYNGSAGTETDYDFLLWKITGSGATTCSAISSSGGGSDVSCNFSFLGVTGLSPTGNAPVDYPGFDGSYEPGVAVLAGETYLLAVQNYTNSLSGFTLDFKNTLPGVIQTNTPTSVTWTGGSNTSLWNTVNNWGGCTMPTCGIDAVVSPASSFQPTVTAAMGTVTVNSLTINPGATLTLGPNSVVRICQNLTNDGTIVADATSSILFNDNTITHTINGTLIGSSSIGNLTITDVAGGTNCTVRANTDIQLNGNFTTSDVNSIFDLNGQNLLLRGNFANAVGATTFTNTANSTLQFIGTGLQTYSPNTATATPVLTLNNVVMNNTGTGVTISTSNTPDMIIGTNGTLTLTAGKIVTPGNQEVTVTNTVPAAVTSGNTSSYIEGNLRRYLPTAAVGSYDFPVGNAALGYELANINFTSAAAPYPINLLARFNSWGGAWTKPAAPNWFECVATYNLPYMDNGYWTIESSASSTGTYTASLYNRGFSNDGASGWSIAKSPSSAPAWALDGYCVPTASPTPVIRTAMSGFSNFATIQSSTVLPVELSLFNVVCKDGFGMLTWSTASELNSKEFIIERSVNGNSFEAIATVAAAGNSGNNRNYTYTDFTVPSGQSYYRLKMVDKDNSFKYSPTNILNCDNRKNIFSVYYSEELGVVIKSELAKSDNYEIELFDALGKLLISENKKLDNGITLSFVKTNKQLPDGVYIVRVKNSSNLTVVTQKLMIQ